MKVQMLMLASTMLVAVWSVWGFLAYQRSGRWLHRCFNDSMTPIRRLIIARLLLLASGPIIWLIWVIWYLFTGGFVTEFWGG